MRPSQLAAASPLIAALSTQAQDALTVIAFGGASGATGKKYMVEPFVAQSGKSI